MDKLIEYNENLDTPLYFSSHLESPKEKHDYFAVSHIETKVPRHDNPQYWLQKDLLQTKQFQYRKFTKIFQIELQINMGTTRSKCVH